jgi:hypothetical protein
MSISPKRSIRLAPIADKRRADEARTIRAALFVRCRAAIDQVGDDIAGFAIVVWDRNGDLRSAYDTSHGPIGPALVPTLAADALNRHVAVMLAAQKAEDESA